MSAPDDQTGCPFHPQRFTPPKPAGRNSRASAMAKLLFGRGNIFSVLNERLYRGWLGRSNLIVHQSYLVNQPDLVRRILSERPNDFPKSPVMQRVLGSLLGEGVFVANGASWARQRRMIDPAFAGGKVRQVFPHMLGCVDDMLARFDKMADGAPQRIDPEMTHYAADVIFRTLFSIPIARKDAYEVFEAFGRFQAAAPFVSPRLLLGLPSLRPWFWPSRADKAGQDIRDLLMPFIKTRQQEIASNTAPDDLATAIMTTQDPETGEIFTAEEMLDQVAVFFLAGHETAASALAWALYLLSKDQDVQDRMCDEAQAAYDGAPAAQRRPEFSDMRKLPLARDVFREALRLYPPVAFFIRAAGKQEEMRDQTISKGSSMILAPWYLQRHERLWDRPDEFDPDRWRTENGKQCARDAYIPFSAGARVCSGAGFAMQEAVLALSEIVRSYRILPVHEHEPQPVMQVTLRSGNGILVRLERAA